MIAPPQVQAQSFAKAILTDITASLFLTVSADGKGLSQISISRWGSHDEMPAISLSASALTTLMPENGWICPSRTASVPLLNSFLAGVNGRRARLAASGSPPTPRFGASGAAVRPSRCPALNLRVAAPVQKCHSAEMKWREFSDPV